MPVQIIAEISANHRGNKQEALALIEMAKQCGADYVKFQCFDPLQMAVDPRPYYKNITPWEWFFDMFALAQELQIPAFASVFDMESLAFIKPFRPAFIKIASFENNHMPLITMAMAMNVPLIISTGMMDWNELLVLDHYLRSHSCTYLKCTSAYPAPDEALNLGAISEMKWRFPTRTIGFSDHTISHDAAMLAVACGAQMIERHIALSQDAVDASCSSVGLIEFEMYVKAVRRAEAMCQNKFGPQSQELTTARRALYSTRDIKPHDKFTDDNVAVLRGPGGGAHPRHYWDLLKRYSARTIRAGEPILTEDAR